jgi:hypothetical protein
MIQNLYFNILIEETENLCNKIALMFGLNHADKDFIQYFANFLKKHFGHLTFEQLETAFEYNSIGSLNEYLPKNNLAVDNKVKFNIPDLTKIIKAYSRLKGLEVLTYKNETEWSQEKINQIHCDWIKQLNGIFEKYMNDLEKSEISTPIYTCEYLAKLGLLDEKSINRNESAIIVRFGKEKKIKSSHNIDLIYRCFDEILENGQVLEKYLN